MSAEREPEITHEYIDVEHPAAYAANRANWDERVPHHLLNYGLESFGDPAYLSDVVAHDLPVLERFAGPLGGQRLVHLQCHIGSDSVSLARAGASVTGVDFSPAAVAAATDLAERLGVDARFVEANVIDAAAAVGTEADVVYTSIGTICWLPDLDAWAQQIHRLLRPGGVFYFRDTHPVALTLDPDSPTRLTPLLHYFAGRQAERWDDPTTYAGDGLMEKSVTYEWPHPISEVLQALLAAGLRLEFFDEGDVLPWQLFPTMQRERGGWVLPPDQAVSVPLTFTVVARREP